MCQRKMKISLPNNIDNIGKTGITYCLLCLYIHKVTVYRGYTRVTNEI